MALPEDPDLIYAGAASGGLWRSTNGGLTFEPVFDDQPVASIGAIAIEPGNPDVIWMGTGEGNPRNSASVGNGVYKSVDGGDTWTHLGLEKTEKIHRILLHPKRPEIAYAAALGTSWGESAERGVFKTTDGGKTWQKVLYVDDKTGAADLMMDPTNPDKLFAAMWDHRRWPWSFRSGGPGSGLHVTHDGGATWKRLTEGDGLPKGHLGRIGLATCASDSKVVYALVEATVEVLADPNADLSDADWQAREDAFERVSKLSSDLAGAVKRMQETRSDLDVIERLARRDGDEDEADDESAGDEDGEDGEDEEGEEESGPHKALLDAVKEIREAFDALEKELRVVPGGKGIVRRMQVDTDIGYASRVISATWEAPTPTDLAYLEKAETRMSEASAELNKIYEEKVGPLREQFEASDLGLLVAEMPE